MLLQRNNYLIYCIIFSVNYILHNDNFRLFIHRNDAREYLVYFAFMMSKCNIDKLYLLLEQSTSE